MTSGSEPSEGLWAAVDRLIDRSPSPRDLRSHGLHLLAARRWRALGKPVVGAIEDEERNAAVRSMVVPVVLERLAAAAADPLVVFKGASVAAAYPDPSLRPFRDIDVLAEDAESVHRRLLAAGFEAMGRASDYDGRHHLAPVVLPQLPLVVEVHRRPEWVGWSRPPATAAIVERAQPAAFGIQGILVPQPADHALLLAAHSWETLPLRRVLDLVDVSLLATAAGRDAVAELAHAWGLARVWLTMLRAADALFGNAPTPMPLRTWARSVRAVRDLTVFENHLRRIASPFWALPPGRACAEALAALGREVALEGGDWGAKRARIAAAFHHPFAPKSRHDLALRDERRARGARRPGDAG